MRLLRGILLGLAGLLVIAIVALALVLSHTSPCPPAETAAGPNTMQAVVRRCYGPPEVLEVTRIEQPAPAEGEVLIAVTAAGVNPLDWHYMRGSPYLMRLMSGIGSPEVARLGRDFAGVVEKVGPGVSRLQPGDPVFGGARGAFSEYLTIKQDAALAAKPDNISFAQAAGVPIAGLTALQALRDHGKLSAGQRVLINGASGGVGTFAVQIAKNMGAHVSGVCSGRNIDLVKSLGADQVFNYKTENYLESGQQFDLIVDMVGNHSPLENSRVLTKTGRLVIVGGAKGDWVGPLIGPLKAWMAGPFVDQELMSFTATLVRDDLATLAEMMASGAVTPVLDRIYSLQEAPEAIRYSESGRARGKIILEMPPKTGARGL